MDAMMNFFRLHQWVIGGLLLQGLCMSHGYAVNIFCDAEIQDSTQMAGRPSGVFSEEDFDGEVERRGSKAFSELEEEVPQAAVPYARPSSNLSAVVDGIRAYRGTEITFLVFHECGLDDQTFKVLTDQLFESTQLSSLQYLGLSGNRLTDECAGTLQRWVDTCPSLQIDVSGNPNFSGTLLRESLESLNHSPNLLNQLIVFTQTEIGGMDLEELDDAQQSAVSYLSSDWFKRHEAYWRVWDEQGMGDLVQPTHGETTSNWHLLRVNDTRS